MSDNIIAWNGAGAAPSLDHFFPGGNQIDRPRVRALLEIAINYPIVMICAGMGYGKTREARAFLRDYDTNTAWLQLTSLDNDIGHFWDSFSRSVSKAWPLASERLEDMGFPETPEEIEDYAALWSETLPPDEKSVFVFDDFQLIENPDILLFFEKATACIPPCATVLILTRTMPEIGIIGMTMSDRIFTIREDALRYTEDEIASHFRYCSIDTTRQDVRDIYEETRGWPYAVNLIGLSLLNDYKYSKYALEVMRGHIYKLFETEILLDKYGSLYHFLLRISLIDNYTSGFIKTLIGGGDRGDSGALIGEMERIDAFIRYDFYLGAYVFNHLLLDYLRLDQHMLCDGEKRGIWQKAGAWCEGNGDIADAFLYYEKAGDFDSIIRIVYNTHIHAPQDIAACASEIFDRIPPEAQENPLFPAMRLKLKMGLGMLDEAHAMAQQYASALEMLPASAGRDRALAELYGIWVIIRMIMCSTVDVYDFDGYLEKQRIYRANGANIADGAAPAAGAAPVFYTVGAYALLAGSSRAGAPDDYIKALSRAIPHASRISDGYMFGLDDLTQGELCFYQWDLDRAEQFLKQAKDKASAKRQYDIFARAAHYLMLEALTRGDSEGAAALLRQIESLLDVREYAVRYEAYDISRAHFHLALGQPELAPDWIKDDFAKFAHSAYMPNYANRTKAMYKYMTQRFNELLAFMEYMRENQTVLYGKISFGALEALSLYQLKRKDEAFAALEAAYKLAAPNKIITHFVQYAKDMRTLAAAALKDDNCRIPKEWLENIHRKASAYAKRQAYMISRFKAPGGDAGSIALTKREMEILKDLTLGMSRKEIAASQNVSVNTVKMIISSMYVKLNVTSLPEAICVAIERRYI